MALPSILIFVENQPVPYDRRVWQHATTLQRAGHAVTVISPAARQWTKPHEVLEDVDIRRYSQGIEGEGKLGLIAEYVWSFLCFLWLTLVVAVRGRGFDVIVLCNPPEIYWPIAGFWRLMGKTIVFDHHDLSPEMYTAKFDRDDGAFLAILRWMERLTFAVAHKVISTNESYAEIARGRGRKKPEDVVVVRNAPDPNRFSILPPEPDLRHGASFMVAFLGEIGEQDGVDVLIRSLIRVRQQMGPRAVHCVLMGGGPAFERIRAYAATEEVDDMITFTGRVGNDTISRVLSSADLAVDPNPYTPYADKSTATKIMEYMHFGLPILAFDLTETRRSAGPGAEYVPHGDERAFADTMVALLQDPGRREELGRSGRERLERDIAWRHSRDRLLALFATLGPKVQADSKVENPSRKQA
ncbi:glycosyltransferase family 4 protein [Aerophototrophica crusticola]|uniref:Glycosyltransferase family 4 protein n=1 Tax=Aerophototrophica crusticola TaxID=1709002 RepID=A0A858R7I8_9PROT|nr:glycosyltransferase family 4 protein [Rhodospirillaceae bacterium B3]